MGNGNSSDAGMNRARHCSRDIIELLEDQVAKLIEGHTIHADLEPFDDRAVSSDVVMSSELKQWHYKTRQLQYKWHE
jgi:hypothetical protein